MIKKIIEDFNKVQEEATKKIKEGLKDSFAELMQKTPEFIQTISFVAYTPYFNDGDPCTFGVYADLESCFINGKQVYDLEEEDNFIDINLGYGENERPNPNYNEEYSKACEAVSELIFAVPEDIWSSMGEGEFIIDRQGNITLEDYNHG